MSAPKFARPLLRTLASLLLLATLLPAQAATTRLTFTNNGGLGGPIAFSGQGGSATIPGLSIQINHISNTTGTPAGTIGWRSALDLSSNDPSFSGLTDNDLNNHYKGMSISSGSGDEFRLTSFRYYNWGEDRPATMSVVGYRNGRQVAFQTFQGYDASFISQTVTLTGFNNVDVVRLFISAGGVNGNTSWHTINNIDIDPVIVPDAPDVPTIYSATPGDGQASIVFTPPADDGGAAITGYRVTASPGGAFVEGAGSPLVVTGLTNGVLHSFTVTATSSAGTSQPSMPSASVTPKGSQTLTFADPGAQNFGTQLTLAATASSNLSVTFNSTTTGVCTISNGNQLTFIATGTCSIDADQAGDAAWSAASTVSRAFTVNAVAPTAPTIGTATPGNSLASVAFAAPASNGGSAITGYTVTASPGGATGTGSASPILVSGLSNGVAYTFTVTATNGIGTGVSSAASAPATPKAPQTITFANPGAQNFGTSPTLTATADSGLTVGFTSATTGVCTISAGGALNFLARGTCTIHADQGGGATFLAAPQVSQSFTVNAIAPGAPTIGTATAGDSLAIVTFSAPASNGGASITSYTATASPGGFTGSGTGSPIVIAGLTNGVAYTFTVTATTSAGTGSASAASNAITPAAAQTIAFANPGAQNFGTTPTLTATSDSGLMPSFSSSTGGVCTITSGGALTFISAGACTIVADQAGNGSYLAAAQVSQTFTVNAVSPGAPTIGTARSIGGGLVEVSFTAPTATGGAPITGYTVTANPGGSTGTGSASPIVVSGLTLGTAYTFTVTATNSAGTGNASASSNSVVAAPALDASPVSASIGYGVASAIALSITGTPTSVAVSTSPTHGSTAISGTAITYTPAPGYAGPDSFSYTASDATTTTAPALVSITVGAPTLTLSGPTTLPGTTAGMAYTQAFTTSGGAAPYTYIYTGTLPTGLTFNNGALSGTPTQAGAFSFSVYSTDSSTGSGPFSTSQAYTLVVGAPQISFTLPTLPPIARGSAYNLRMQVSGGAAPYTYTVDGGALPSGMQLASDGLLSGAPDGVGTFTFSLKATDALGFSASQAYTLQVDPTAQVIRDFAANPQAPVFSPNGRFALTANGGGSDSPLIFATTSAAVCRVEGSSVVMLTPGRCSLTANQAGNALYTAAAALSLEVDIAALVPELQWPQELHKAFGEAAFDLADPQSPSRGAFSYTSSAPGVASVQGRTVTLVGEGVTVITVTQAAAGSYTAATAQLRLTVTVRPDPTRDAGVVAGLQAQVDASVRFARAQQSNIRDRLRQVRSGSNASSNQLSVNYAGGEDRPNVSLPMGAVGTDALPSLPAGWGAWASGSASFGTGGRRGGSFDFHSDGLSIGVDHAVGDQLLFGLAGSFGRNDSNTDDNDSRVQADQRSLAAYGLWRAGEHLFVDGMIANGSLSFDTRRWSREVNAVATGDRDGDQWFGALSFGYEHRGTGMSLTSYGRVEASRTTLDAYRENGLDLYDLDYRRQVVQNSAVALGLEGSYVAGNGEGRVRPFWSIEYRQALEDKGQAYLNYVIGPRAQDYRLDMQSYNDHALSIAAGMDVRLQRGWFLSLLLGHEQTRGSSRASNVGLRLSYGSSAGAGSAVATDPASATAPRCNPRRCPPAANTAASSRAAAR